MRARYHLEYASVQALATALRGLPRGAALAVGAAIGELGWLLAIRRSVVLGNLRQALPATDPDERRRIAARAARNFGRTVAEFVRFAGADRRRVGDLVAIDGLGPLQAALAAGGGAIVVTGHLGAWALYVTALAATGVPSALLVGRQHNPKVQRFILGIPGDAVRFVPKSKGSPREILKCLREGRAVVMVADHNSGRGGEFVPFFGKVASTLPLPGAIAARHATPIFIMAGHRVGGGRHRVTISAMPLPTAESEEARRGAITTACNTALAEAILDCPEQYFWYHRRWRDDVRPRAAVARSAAE
jgi:Kdo2-lipid IVA lauroyltransferase/acyltransferase